MTIPLPAMLLCILCMACAFSGLWAAWKAREVTQSLEVRVYDLERHESGQQLREFSLPSERRIKRNPRFRKDRA